MIPLLNFIAVILLIFVTSYLFIEMYNIKMYLETNENQLNNLVDDINHNNEVLKGKLDDNDGINTKLSSGDRANKIYFNILKDNPDIVSNLILKSLIVQKIECDIIKDYTDARIKKEIDNLIPYLTNPSSIGRCWNEVSGNTVCSDALNIYTNQGANNDDAKLNVMLDEGSNCMPTIADCNFLSAYIPCQNQ
jgi:hypothetical protein